MTLVASWNRYYFGCFTWGFLVRSERKSAGGCAFYHSPGVPEYVCIYIYNIYVYIYALRGPAIKKAFFICGCGHKSRPCGSVVWAQTDLQPGAFSITKLGRKPTCNELCLGRHVAPQARGLRTSHLCLHPSYVPITPFKPACKLCALAGCAAIIPPDARKRASWSKRCKGGTLPERKRLAWFLAAPESGPSSLSRNSFPRHVPSQYTITHRHILYFLKRAMFAHPSYFMIGMKWAYPLVI